MNRVYDYAVLESDTEARALMVRAVAAFDSGDRDAALSIVRGVIRQRPDFARNNSVEIAHFLMTLADWPKIRELLPPRSCFFLNSGDVLKNGHVLAEVMDAVLKADIVYGNMIIRHSDGREELGKMPERITFHHMIIDTLWQPVSFIKRDLFLKYGFYREDLKIVSDYEFFLKTIIVHKVPVQYVPITISVFLLDGMSSDPSNVDVIKAERKKVQSKYFHESILELVDENRARKSNICYKLDSLWKKTVRWFRS